MTNHAKLTPVVGAVVAAGAIALAATIVMPTARADDLSEILAPVEADFAAGQSEFTTALSDFSAGDAGTGLAALFSGVDDDTLAAPNNLVLGSLEALTGNEIAVPLAGEVADPANLAAAFTDIQALYGQLPGLFESVPGELGGNDLAAAAYLLFAVPPALTIEPLQELLIGAVNGL